MQRPLPAPDDLKASDQGQPGREGDPRPTEPHALGSLDHLAQRIRGTHADPAAEHDREGARDARVRGGRRGRSAQVVVAAQLGDAPRGRRGRRQPACSGRRPAAASASACRRRAGRACTCRARCRAGATCRRTASCVRCARATDSRIRLTIGKLRRKPGPSGIGRPSQTVVIPAALSSRVTPSTRRRYSAIQRGRAERADRAVRRERRPCSRARRRRRTRAPRPAASLRDHLVEARVPVVEVGSREPGREPALDGDARRSRPRDALERIARHLGERVAGDPDAQRVRRGEAGFGGRGRPVRSYAASAAGAARPAAAGSGAPRMSISSSCSRPIATCSVVPRRRQVQRAADRDERPRQRERHAPLDALRLDLRLLAQPLGVEQRGEPERERAGSTMPAQCGCRERASSRSGSR